MSIFNKKNIDKYNLRFTKDQRNISFVLESQLGLGSPDFMPYYKGTYTLRKTQDALDETKSNFLFTKENILEGFFETKDLKVLDLMSPSHKVYKKFTSSIYHMFADDISEVISAIEIYPKSQYILDVTDIRPSLDLPEWDFFKEFLTTLGDKNIDYMLVDLFHMDLVYINNVSLCIFPFQSGIKADNLFNFFNYCVTDTDVKPYRKVYLSRKKVIKESTIYEKLVYKSDTRIDSHEEIEDLFLSHGFEVVYPEDFGNFREQVNFFYSVKTLASITSSGLVNACFMQDNGNVIEIVTPLVAAHPLMTKKYLEENDYGSNMNIVTEMHSFYHDLATLKNHLFIGIPNLLRKTSEIKKYISNNKILESILNNE